MIKRIFLLSFSTILLMNQLVYSGSTYFQDNEESPSYHKISSSWFVGTLKEIIEENDNTSVVFEIANTSITYHMQNHNKKNKEMITQLKQELCIEEGNVSFPVIAVQYQAISPENNLPCFSDPFHKKFMQYQYVFLSYKKLSDWSEQQTGIIRNFDDLSQEKEYQSFELFAFDTIEESESFLIQGKQHFSRFLHNECISGKIVAVSSFYDEINQKSFPFNALILHYITIRTSEEKPRFIVLYTPNDVLLLRAKQAMLTNMPVDIQHSRLKEKLHKNNQPRSFHLLYSVGPTRAIQISETDSVHISPSTLPTSNTTKSMLLPCCSTHKEIETK